MNRRRGNVSGGGMPMGPWDRTPAGIRASLISLPIVFGIYLLNSLGLNMFHNSMLFQSIPTVVVLCYPVQLLGYVLNGWIAGAQARSTHDKAVRRVGRQGEVVRRRHPDYIGASVLAGILLAVYLMTIYFIAGTSVKNFLPGLQVVRDIAQFFYLVVDAGLCIGCATLGGMIYQHFS
jgi:hypothetical protein